MRWLALPAGVLVLSWTLLDVVRTLVIPRAARGRVRLSRLLFRLIWPPWRWLGLRRANAQARERILAGAAPSIFLALLVGWAFLTLSGYALILWSPAFAAGMPTGSESFGDAVYLSGTSLFTLGFAGAGPTGWTRAVSVVAGATGLGLFAVVIAYLPVLYQAFNRREVGVLMLDARAGSPPSGPELLHRMAPSGGSSLPRLFDDWERWVADVLESHMSYPLLTLFRSPHDNTSWITSLGSVLDAATLMITAVDEAPDERTKLMYGTGVHAVEDLFHYLRLTERETAIKRDEFESVLLDMKNDGFSIRSVDDAYSRFTEKRGKYAPRLEAIVDLLGAPPGLWIGDRSFLGASTPH